MAKSKVFWFTDPDGGKHKRSSKTREYSHAILIKNKSGWGIYSCVGRPDLVAPRLAECEWRKEAYGEEIVAVPVDAE